jgi:hypothetical protein
MSVLISWRSSWSYRSASPCPQTAPAMDQSGNDWSFCIYLWQCMKWYHASSNLGYVGGIIFLMLSTLSQVQQEQSQLHHSKSIWTLAPLGFFLPGSQSSFVVYLRTDCNLLCWSFIVCPLSFISSHFHQRKRRKRVQSNSRLLESSKFPIHERVFVSLEFSLGDANLLVPCLRIQTSIWFHVWEFLQTFGSLLVLEISVMTAGTEVSYTLPRLLTLQISFLNMTFGNEYQLGPVYYTRNLEWLLQCF